MSVMNQEVLDREPAVDESAQDLVYLGLTMRIIIGAFVVIPLIAVAFALPIAWGGWLSWLDITLAIGLWLLTAGGITIGYHRYFTHGSFKANRTVKIILAVFGSLAIEGSLDQWVADHRKHHKFSDEVGDPHSPWRFGTSKKAIGKGLLYSHVGWLFDDDNTGIDKYAPDIAADKDLNWISKHFSVFVISSLLLPAVLGGLITAAGTGAVLNSVMLARFCSPSYGSPSSPVGMIYSPV